MTKRDAQKPPYRVPSMDEIRALRPNGHTVATTFAGGGGSSTGYEMAGFRIVWANEFVAEAADTYQANHPNAVVDRRSIREISGRDVLAAAKVREVDLLDGSPPCQSFSMAGSRAKGWGKVRAHADGSTQRADDLFVEYARLLGELRPKIFVAENVSGLVQGSAKGYFKEIMRDLGAAGPGYVVEARLVDAQWLGVPQARVRLIFVGVRSDLANRHGIGPVFPRPLPYFYSVQDALPWIRKIRISKNDFKSAATSPARTVLVNDHSGSPTEFRQGKGYVEADCWLENTAIGREWERLHQGQNSQKYFNLVRAHARRPSPTITASAGHHPGTAGVTHPTEKRKFTIPELKRICGFPDDYVLTGSRAQQWARLGNAVPPVMMAAIARGLVPLLDLFKER